jgi:hypothetical protein
MNRRIILAAAMLALTGCSLLDSIGGRQLRPEYCNDHPQDPDCRQSFPDADAGGCTSNTTCAAPTSVCEISSGTCVQCIAPDQVSACNGTSPVCGDDHACRGCTAHADCPSSMACLPDGSCAAEAQVAYVDPAQGNGKACSLVAPCKKVADALATARPYAKLTGSLNEQVQLNGQNVTVLANPGTTLTSTTNGILVEVRGASHVEIYDLTIMGASGPSGIGLSLPAGNTASVVLGRVTISNNIGGGISSTGGTIAVSLSAINGNAGGGINATGGSVTVSRSSITGNTGSGISLSQSQFDITNSIIASNGGPSASVGGVRLDQTNAGTRRFDFNTVTNNNGMDGNALGVVCTLVGQPVTFSGNIVYANQVGGTRTQVGGANCNWSYSDIGPDTTTGTGNINSDPLFVNPAQSNFHIQAGSPAKDKADPAATVNVDLDGDARPQGSGFDMGADEVK